MLLNLMENGDEPPSIQDKQGSLHHTLVAITKRCCGCKRELPLTEYHKNKTRSDGLRDYCKICVSEQYQKKHIKRHSEEICPECDKTFTYTWKGHRIYCSDECRLQAKQRISVTGYRDKSRNLRDEVFIILGGKCTHCSITDKRVLQIDHINGGGRRDRKNYTTEANYYRHIININCDGYQLLCANCNWIKRYERKEQV
jgi:hypothetical protein